MTLHFSTPWADFNVATASLAAYSPVRKDKDKGDKSLFDVFSNGPYMLEGTFDPNKGGTWVRNPNWDESTDKVRKAYPDKIVDVEGDPERADLPAADRRRWRGQDGHHVDDGPARRPSRRSRPTRPRPAARSTPTPPTSTTCSRTSPPRS